VVRYAVVRGVATLTLDSPDNRNALSAQLVSELEARLAEVAGDGGVRAAVLTHSGTTFCSGADLSEAPARGTGRLLVLLRQILVLPKPVVATLDGHARAGGLGLLGACDIVLAGPRSTFAFSEARLGLAPAVISLTTLPRLSGRAAGRYYLTGEVFDAATAARIGLVTEAVDDPDRARDGVLGALRLASPQGLAESKRLTTAAALRRLDEDGEQMSTLSARLFSSAEAAEGIEAYRQRRSPRWEL
jgi:enoyl-CoA hydratase